MAVSERLTFDPTLRDQGIPEDIPQYPIGTVDEAEELGLPVIAYRTCSRPVRGVSRGCGSFSICELSCKGKSIAEGGGPRVMAVELAKPGQRIRRVKGECYKLIPRLEDWRSNGWAVKVIATEPGMDSGLPDSYEMLTGHYVKTFVDPATNQTTKVLAKDGEQHLPNVKREDTLMRVELKPFKRPHENPDIATDLLTAQAAAAEQERINAEAYPRALGIDPRSTPLDQRNRKVGKGKNSGAEGSA